jgi:PHD/YefM family antitoxin component YafN of YafNO toxin-antitoxin module
MRVSSAEFPKDCGKLVEKALAEPVTITRDGRDHLILLSVAEYDRLRRDRHVYAIEDMTPEQLDALEKSEVRLNTLISMTS